MRVRWKSQFSTCHSLPYLFIHSLSLIYLFALIFQSACIHSLSRHCFVPSSMSVSVRDDICVCSEHSSGSSLHGTPRLNSHHVTLHFLLWLAARDQTQGRECHSGSGSYHDNPGTGMRCVSGFKIGGVNYSCGVLWLISILLAGACSVTRLNCQLKHLVYL